jgi:hypothetical protein
VNFIKTAEKKRRIGRRSSAPMVDA